MANIRDVRNLEYNVKSEEAPGNMTKRMLELTALLEMQGQGFPVEPSQIIEKMDIAASEKERWLKYIHETQAAEQQQQQEMVEKQIAMEEEKLDIERTGQQLDFMASMAKVKQMIQKDEQRAREEFSKLGSKERADLMNFVAQMAQVAATVEAAESQARAAKAQGGKKDV